MTSTNMTPKSIIELKELTSQIPEKIPYIKMLVLFGSRATGKTHTNSDWDFAVLPDEQIRQDCIKEKPFGMFEIPLLLGQIFGINHEKIDVVELNNCSWLVSHFIARDGILLYEKDFGGFDYFRQTSLRSEPELKKFRQEQRQLLELDLKRLG
jgi:uncharacterized protein